MAKTTTVTSEKQKSQSTSQSTESQKSQSTTQAILNSELLGQILAGLQDAGYTQKTTDELMQIAQNYYLPQYNAEIEAARQAQAAKDLSYTQQLENLASTYGKSVDTQNAAYDQSRAALETGALARGMGRSSYVLSTLNNNDQARSAALAQLADDYSQNVRQVTDQQTQSAAQSAETIGRLEADKATNISNRLTELADAEYQKYVTGLNQQNSNYLAAVQAAMGQQTTGVSTGTSSTNTSTNTSADSTQVTTTAGGSGSGGSGDDSGADDVPDSVFDAEIDQNAASGSGSTALGMRPKGKTRQYVY